MALIQWTSSSQSAASTSSQALGSVQDVLYAIIDRFGLLIPSLVLGLLILACIYPTRVAFTPGARPGIREVPGGLPLIGHTYMVIRDGTKEQYHRFHEMALKSDTRCSHLSIVGIGSLLVLNRPEYIDYVQKTNFDNFPKGKMFRERLGDLLGHDGIFVADGQVWHAQRKMASHMFSAHQFNNWVRVVVQHELGLVDALLDTMAHQPHFSIEGLHTTAPHPQNSLKGGMINMPELLFRYTLSSFARMAFGADLGCLTEDPASLQRAHPFAVAFDYAQGVINERFQNPFWYAWELVSPKGRRMRQSIKLIRNFGMAIIKQRLIEAGVQIDGIDVQMDEKNGFSKADLQQSVLQKDEGAKDLLALFMEQTQDPEALLTVVLNFMIAGRDTTAQTLSWLFYELCANPQHVVAIREELDRVLGQDAAARRQWLRYDEYKKLPYTLACFHEASRLHPAVPKNGKTTLADDLIVPQGPNPHNLPTIKVYKGEQVTWSDWVMNRLPEVWGEDAEQFNPERFLQRDDHGAWSYVQHKTSKFHSFNHGPRLCLGMNLAGYEGVAFVAATLQKYDFSWASDAQGQTSQWPPMYANSITHPMQDAFQCIITPRQT